MIRSDNIFNTVYDIDTINYRLKHNLISLRLSHGYSSNELSYHLSKVVNKNVYYPDYEDERSYRLEISVLLALSDLYKVEFYDLCTKDLSEGYKMSDKSSRQLVNKISSLPTKSRHLVLTIIGLLIKLVKIKEDKE